MNIVYFDMDGVLADFDGDFTRRTGRAWDHNAEWSKEEKWEMISKHPYFFRDLPWIKGALAMVQFVAYAKPFTQYVPGIMSAASSHITESADQKREWLARELPILTGADHIHIVAHREEKAPFARPGDILIDDHKLNIADWNAAGGIGIFFEDAVQAIEELQKHLKTPEQYYTTARIFADKNIDASPWLEKWSSQ